MGRLSDAVINDVLDALFGGRALDIPATYHVGLSSTTPSTAAGGVTEPAGNAYARVAVPNDDTHWAAASGRATSNATAIVFAAATGTGWGTATHVVLWRTPAGTGPADMAGWGELDTPVTVNAGGNVQFPPGTLVVDAPGA